MPPYRDLPRHWSFVLLWRRSSNLVAIFGTNLWLALSTFPTSRLPFGSWLLSSAHPSASVVHWPLTAETGLSLSGLPLLVLLSCQVYVDHRIIDD